MDVDQHYLSKDNIRPNYFYNDSLAQGFYSPYAQHGTSPIEEGASYYCKKKGEYLSAENYWANKQFKSQPGYIMGKLLRKTASGVGGFLQDSFSVLKTYLSSMLEYGNTEIEENEPYIHPTFFPSKEKYEKILHEEIFLGKFEFAKDMYELNMDFSLFCDKAFVDLIKMHKEDKSVFFKIEALLEVGAFNLDGYWWAVQHQDHKLLDLFKDKGRIKETEEIKESISRSQYIDEGLLQNYNFLESKINEAIMLARKNHKPLMVIIGEDHEKFEGSFPNELIALEILAEKLSPQHLMTESPLELCKFRNPLATEKWCKYTFQDMIEKRAKALGFKQTPIDCVFYYDQACKKGDITACKKKEDMINDYRDQIQVSSICDDDLAKQNISDRIEVNCDYEKIIKIRNLVMGKMTQKFSSGDVVLIVGAAHIYGLMKETDLAKDYFILPIETAALNLRKIDIYDYLDICKAFLTNADEVVSVPAISQIGIKHVEGFEPIPADLLIEKVLKVHQKSVHTAYNLKEIAGLGSQPKEPAQCKKRNVYQQKLILDF